MRSAVALLLVLVCANTNYVAFAVMENEGNFPEPLIGEEVETVDLIEKTEITAASCVTLGPITIYLNQKKKS